MVYVVVAEVGWEQENMNLVKDLPLSLPKAWKASQLSPTALLEQRRSGGLNLHNLFACGGPAHPRGMNDQEVMVGDCKTLKDVTQLLLK